MGLKQKSRVTAEEQATIIATSGNVVPMAGRAPRILLLKPYQDTPTLLFSPPLGLLYLVASLREKFGKNLVVDVIDMKVHRLEPEWLIEKFKSFRPDIVGVSALNYEASVSHRIAEMAHQWNPDCITAIGGPYALHQTNPIFERSEFDWVFEGTSDRTFPEAARRLMAKEAWGEDLPGFSWRKDGTQHITDKVDVVSDLDELPMPAWDLCEFELYAKRPTFTVFAAPGRYATLFTSRGCPYLCSYCHDLFTKKFKWRSTDNVIAEMEHLIENYGVQEFQIVDDIFNLHKPRLIEIMNEVDKRWPGQLKFSFPNGLRADILDEEVIDALVRGGAYFVALAVETVTPRLQDMIEKYLDVDKTRWAVDELEKRGVTVNGFFMMGFPTETEQELQQTVNFALESKMTLASFFTVVPQPETPLYKLAEKEGAEALKVIESNELEGGLYRNDTSWYSLAYDFPLQKKIRMANWFFYGNPFRALKIFWRWPKLGLWRNMSNIMYLLIPGWSKIAKLGSRNSANKLSAAPASLGVSDADLANPERLREKRIGSPQGGQENDSAVEQAEQKVSSSSK